MRILVVEDQKKVAQALKKGLEAEHYEVEVASTGEDGFFLVSSQTFDLVLLDLMLPGRSGIDVLHTMREQEIQTPVLILTARDAVEDRVIGLDAGADDYLVKPFAFPELLARIRALLRRGRSDQLLRLKFSDLEMDLVTRQVRRADQEIQLSAREYDLLEYLLRNCGHVVSRQMLARDVWQETDRVTPIDNVIDVHITRLRKKVDQPFEQPLIRTVRGVGFVIGEETQ
ncbi:response regulator transcription factor [Gemmatimonadota bacterium]